MITDKKIKQGLDKAYKKAGNNAYFGNGFEAGVKFAMEQVKLFAIPDVRLSLSNIQEAANNALLKTRQSKGIQTNNITERELELAERAFINGAIWAKNTIQGNEA